MEKCLDHLISFAGQTSSDGVMMTRGGEPELVGYSDSDWSVSHSTSAHLSFVLGEGGAKACVGYGSRRQQCIAMSSTEAEIIAASQAALELVFLRRLLREMGESVDKPTVLYVDNSGAVELSKHQKSCHRSRHVMRRYFKVRELVAEGLIEVKWVDTKENLADLLSKGTIEPEQYEKLRAGIMHCKDSGRRFQG